MEVKSKLNKMVQELVTGQLVFRELSLDEQSGQKRRVASEVRR